MVHLERYLDAMCLFIIAMATYIRRLLMIASNCKLNFQLLGDLIREVCYCGRLAFHDVCTDRSCITQSLCLKQWSIVGNFRAWMYEDVTKGEKEGGRHCTGKLTELQL